MATATPKHPPGLLLGATPTTIMVVGAGKSFTFRSIIATNNTAAPLKLFVWLVPQGESPNDANAICNGLTIPGPGGWGDDAPHVLEEGGSLVGQGEVADGFNLTPDGSENTA